MCHHVKNIFIRQKNAFDHKIYLLKLRGKLNNLVLKVSQHPICGIP